MPFLRRSRASGAAVVALGAVLAAVSAYASLSASATTLALLVAAYVLAEALQHADDDLAEGQRFSLSAPVHVAAILVAGPWPAAVVALVGTWAVRPLRGDTWRPVVLRSVALAVAGVLGGYAFLLAGGEFGSIRLPEDLLPAVLGGLVYWVAKTMLEGLVSGEAVLHPDVLLGATEIGLGLALAVAALDELWLAAALAPVLLLLDRLYRRVGVLRRETATALETFANIVDERDASTRGHSLRVADYVRDLALALGLPPREARRLWWAGRLHDLGKVAVDSAVLRKEGKLTPAEWSTVWRAPRLSARLLQRFRFAAQQAQAVEYHGERYNGTGYYGARPEDIPLAAHFLIVADSFDAMTSYRPFRERLSPEDALEELEVGAGTQFHPVVARAFIAARRGEDPASVLTPEELASVRDTAIPMRLPFAGGELRRRHELFLLAGGVAFLTGLGAELLELAAVGAAFAVVGLTLLIARRLRIHRLTKALDDALTPGSAAAPVFERVVEAVDRAWPLRYAAFVRWEEDGSGGSVQLERGEARPPDAALVSWLLREAESGESVLLDAGAELPDELVSLAIPLRRENSSLVGFLVLRADGWPPAHLSAALAVRIDRLERASEPRPIPFERRRSAAKGSGPDGRQKARSLEA
jgi:HD-GYP domain-containing protein (c-di-GMP phosphodiesterase class II)